MNDFILWGIPLTFLLCMAAVQSLRRHWQNALCAALGAGICLAIMACYGQSHRNAILRGRLHHLEIKTKELQNQIDKMNRSSNQTVLPNAAGAVQENH